MAASTYTITFGDCAENHVGMQKIGEMANEGYSFDDLLAAKDKLEKEGAICEFVDLGDLIEDHSYGAAILIIRNGANHILKDDQGRDKLLAEQRAITYDSQYYDTRRKRVLNKRARHNVCFGIENQEPDYENKKGRIVSFSDVPVLAELREKLGEYLPGKAVNLQAEGNYYYDVSKCFIGAHGDGERKKVLALRLGASMNLCYQWYYQYNPVSELKELILASGDMYIMSEKATGNDWKRKNIMTLRHSAGCAKYTTNKK